METTVTAPIKLKLNYLTSIINYKDTNEIYEKDMFLNEHRFLMLLKSFNDSYNFVLKK